MKPKNNEALNGLMLKVERLTIERDAALDHGTFYQKDNQIKRVQRQIDQLRNGRRKPFMEDKK